MRIYCERRRGALAQVGGAGGRDDRDDRRRQGERTETRLAHRSGYYSRPLITRVGTLEHPDGPTTEEVSSN